LPFFFTTTSELEVDENATVNFGIGHSLSGLIGKLLNDAGQGIAGVTVVIRSRGQKWSATTEADGSFFVSALAAGDYEVQVDDDSLPVGYATDVISEPQRVRVGASSPGKAAFSARAIRSISGRVLVYDTRAGAYIPVTGQEVTLREPRLIAVSGALGQYRFPDLAAGSFTVAVESGSDTLTRVVRLGGQPIDLNVEFKLGPPKVRQVAEMPTPVALPVLPMVSRQATPEQHHALGRELITAGRYREAVVELTEALRLAPGFALAYNARGYAFIRLRKGTLAVSDLDQAIRLNPAYANAYHNRAIAKQSLGDAAGAAADLKRSEQLARR
jgi:hypothetical protein